MVSGRSTMVSGRSTMVSGRSTMVSGRSIMMSGRSTISQDPPSSNPQIPRPTNRPTDGPMDDGVQTNKEQTNNTPNKAKSISAKLLDK